MDKINKIAECIKAFKGGKTIEAYIPTEEYERWVDIKDSEMFEMAIADYVDESGDLRIKKEPIVIWTNWYTFGTVYLNKDDAMRHCGKGGITMKFIEDLS